jgi:hypothetical protein
MLTFQVPVERNADQAKRNEGKGREEALLDCKRNHVWVPLVIGEGIVSTRPERAEADLKRRWRDTVASRTDIYRAFVRPPLIPNSGGSLMA